ncbi:MAG: dTDP-4-dehydrorhamnose reductase [Lentisphaerales bacterium]|jgi:dTDP-4-dehydrorhamnose reductase|nr:MAG: dTDP-4-dehydrorhamnose reductase [Lentisphaerales bacterium]
MKNVTILGARGMLGSDLCSTLRESGWSVNAVDLPEVDITRRADVETTVSGHDWVVNCAAYTNVDGAETETEQAFAVNRDGASNVAHACTELGIKLLHVSTDYVFDGRADRPYREEDPVAPLSTYGASKLAGEEEIRRVGGVHIIMRTQSLFGIHGRNFVASILKKLEADAATLKVVNDQVSSPTYTGHLAGAIRALLGCGNAGTVHVSASGECSWYEFACAILDETGLKGSIEPVLTSEYKLPAVRPAYSVLDGSRFTEWTGETLPDWRKGLEDYIRARSVHGG